MICSTLFGGKDESVNVMPSSSKSPFRFLIILDNDEFQQQSCWFSYSKVDQILYHSHLFPGKLDVLSYKQFTQCSHLYNFFNEGIIKKNCIYVRMPKEKKYILIEEFTKQLVFLQLNEINVLFLRLNTENVKIKYICGNHDENQCLVGIHPGLDEYIESMGATDHECVEIRYPLPTQLPLIHESKYVFYEKWKPLIKHRIEDGKFFDEFLFKYNKPEFLNKDFYEKMRTCGICIDENENLNEKDFELHFEIFYYPDEMIYYIE